jgi:hypothetical protein
MTRLKLACRTHRSLLRTRYLPVSTTFLTLDGPEIGTIWFDKDHPKKPPRFVKSVDKPGNRVRYEDGWEYLSNFFENVRTGRYVLIGVIPDTHMHVVTPRQ